MEDSHPTSKSSVGMNEILPPEILRKIFSYLEVRQLLKITPVCKVWWEVIKDPVLYKELKLSASEIRADQIVRLLEGKKHLQRISLHRYCEPNDIIRSVAQHCPRLTHLNAVHCHIQASVLKDVTVNCPSVAHLTVEHCKLNWDIKESQTLLNFRNLRSLKFLSIDSRNSKSLRISLEQSAMEELVVTSSELIPESNVANILNGCKGTLRKVVLDASEITSNNTYLLLSSCKNLQILYLGCCFTLSDSQLALLTNLRKLMQLTFIGIGSTELSKEGLEQFFSRGCLGSLLHLDLSCCCVVDSESLSVIATNCPHLVFLEVRGCQKIGDAGVISLVERCRNLQYLGISLLSLVTGESLRMFPENVPRLKLLNLCYCFEVDRESVVTLQGKMPHLGIIHSCNIEETTETEANIQRGEEFYNMLTSMSLDKYNG